MSEYIGILGAGGQADEAASFLEGAEVKFFAVGSAYLDAHNDRQIDITTPTVDERETRIVAAVGAPAIRQYMIEQWPGEMYTTIVAKDAYVDPSCEIGEGTIIAPGVIITTNVTIGKHSIINVGASISHNSRLGDYATVSPGARIAGNVSLGDGVFVGIGATISNDIHIAPGVVVGAGAVVVDNVETPNAVVVGCPAKSIRTNKEWLRAI